MPDVDRGDRPLSPFMIGTYYRPQITSMLSILHRITGTGMAVTALLIVWWFAAAAIGADAFTTADGVLSSWFGLIVLIASLWAFWFHFFNGIRHLRWDSGAGLGLRDSARTGWAALSLSVVMTIVSIVLAV